MICPPCRERKHEDCPGGTRCDCQHHAEGVNRKLVPARREPETAKGIVIRTTPLPG